MCTKGFLAIFSSSLPRSPDGARVKQKMVYSATKEAVKKKLGDMVGINLQATDQDEISEKNMGEQVMKFERA